ncbi:MAG: hypothetical protein PVH87_08930 [Desulfobacteraceae bacterium]|jgi:hypothetical protein
MASKPGRCFHGESSSAELLVNGYMADVVDVVGHGLQADDRISSVLMLWPPDWISHVRTPDAENAVSKETSGLIERTQIL